MSISAFARIALAAVLALGATGAAAATFTVTSTADTNTSGTLRWAIGQANATAALDTINFNIPGGGVQTLTPGVSTSPAGQPLPSITQPVVIDGTTQPGYAGTPLIAIAGGSAGIAGSSGLTLSTSGATVKGLAVYGFNTHGILLSNGGGNTITLCHLGVTAPGTAVAPNARNGVRISNSSDNIVGPGNVITGNSVDGINLEGSTTRTLVKGNYIGLLANGLAAGNGFNGVVVLSAGNTIGGSGGAAERNVISGNGRNGVAIAGVNGNLVQNNFIGTNTAGTAAFPNALAGVLIQDASDNSIGANSAGLLNLISGNSQDGIRVARVSGSANNNVIQRNVIGTNLAGTAALPNTENGIDLEDATNTVIGTGTLSNGANLISGNLGPGVGVTRSNGTVLRGNFIGPSFTGTARLGSSAGVRIINSDNVHVGASGLGNLISGNSQHGIYADGATNLVVEGNVIGLAAGGTAALGNTYGIYLTSGAVACANVTVGGAFGTTGNLISGNHDPGFSEGAGVYVRSCSGVSIKGNRIGTSQDGRSAIANDKGIYVDSGSTVGVGGSGHSAWTCDGECNLISGNSYGGIDSRQVANLAIAGNFIGTNVDGSAALSNNTVGVYAWGNAQLSANLISGNNGIGVLARGSASEQATLQDNRIGTDAAGLAALPNNGSGVQSADAIKLVVVGNVISGNAGNGINIPAPGPARDHRIEGNDIGTGSDTITCLGNSQAGVRISGYASGANIGGPNAVDGNVIACNGGNGIALLDPNVHVRVSHNAIYGNAQLDIDLYGGGFGGITPNDSGDADGDVNTLQNYPVLTSAQATGANLAIAGDFNSAPNGTYTLEFYDTATCGALGYGGGRRYIGETTVTTNGSGYAPISLSLPAAASENEQITATATDAAGNTSEFSGCRFVTIAPAVLTLSAASYAVAENGGSVTITVFRSGNTSTAVSASYATADASAIAGSDYSAAGGTLNFAVGATSASFSVPIANDALAEPTEAFQVSIAGAGGVVQLGSPSSASVSINDDDPAPSLSVDNGGCSVTEGDSGARNCDFVLRLSSASGVPVDLTTQTASVSAASYADFTPHFATARQFLPGQTTLVVSVPVLGDAADENDETFTLSIAGVSNASPASLSATGSITDDDAPPTLSIDNGGCSIAETNGNTSCTFAFRLSAASGKPISFTTQTIAGTATDGSDYIGHGPTARTIDPGQTGYNVYVPVIGDLIQEADETFTLSATAIANASPASLTGTATLLNDDTLPSLSIDNNGCSVTEGNSGSVNCNFVFRLSQTSTSAVTFNTFTTENNAVAGVDFTAHGSTARAIPAGQTTLTVAVPVLGDTRDEDDETFVLGVSNIANAATNGPLSGLGSILDNDAAPSIGITGCTLSEGNSGTANCAFQLSLAAASGKTVSVSWAQALSELPALKDSLETPSISGVVFEPAGQILGAWTVDSGSVELIGADFWQPADGGQSMDMSGYEAGSIHADVPVIAGQPYRIHFALAGNGACGSAVKQLQLWWNGALLGTYGFDTAGHDYANMGWQRIEVGAPAPSGASARLRFTSLEASACGPALDEVTVVRSGVAAGPQDWPAATGSVTFGPGETTVTQTAQVNGDTLPEGNEVFAIVLSGGSNHGSLAAGTITIVDDDQLADAVFKNGFE